MKNQNICKFPIASLSEPLSIHCFVYESDPENLARPLSLHHHRIILVTQGQGRFFLDGDPIFFQTGTLIFGFMGESLRGEPSENCTLLYVDFSGNRAEELFRRFGIRRGQRSFDGFGGMIPLWKESLARASRETIDLAAESVLLHTLSRMRMDQSAHSSAVTEMIEITENQFNDSGLSISYLSERLSYHPKYLSHLFKKEMGVGYSEYLRNIRINYARVLLDHGIDSVKNVALLSGFSDPLYFSGVFKKVVGVAPKDYLQSHHESASDGEDSP